MLEPVRNTTPLDYAMEIVELRDNPRGQARIDELADKHNEEVLTDAERDEYDDYLQAIHVIGILQRKARRVLAYGSQSSPVASLTSSPAHF
jgi:hypothetical protein